jgi:hypothetical protein
MTSLLLVAALAQAPAPEPEVFVDRGESYVRMGFAQGLTKGVTVEIISADKKAVLGTAVVMEVWDSLARINLDAASTAFKGLKHARLRGAGAPPPAAIAPPPPPPPPPSTPGKVPVSPPPAPPSSAAGGRRLNGRVSISAGALEARRVIISNQDSFDWHGCKVILPDGRAYSMSELRSYSEDGIMMFRFEVGEALRDPQGLVTIRCQEGEGRYAVEL